VGAGESLVHWWLLPGLARLESTLRRWTLNFDNLRNDEMLERLSHASLDIAVTTRFEPDSRLRAEAAGMIEYGLFVPEALIGDQPGRSVRSGRRRRPILDGLPLAILGDRSGGVLRALESEASRTDCRLDIRMRLSSYPQLAMAVRTGVAAAVMPTRAATVLEGSQYQMLRPPFLAKVTRKVWIVWNRSMIEIRPAIPAAVQHLRRALE
jgi:DNA-binding transcriptional LysR family regulator